MTFEERLAALGVDLSDLPTGIDYTIPQEEAAMEAAADFGGGLEAYILHLTEIIDRMETRLVNVTGERDWLKSVLENHLFCETCVGGQGMEPCVNGHLCSTDNPNYRYSGIPEDWSVDE